MFKGIFKLFSLFLIGYTLLTLIVPWIDKFSSWYFEWVKMF